MCFFPGPPLSNCTGVSSGSAGHFRYQAESQGPQAPTYFLIPALVQVPVNRCVSNAENLVSNKGQSREASK